MSIVLHELRPARVRAALARLYLMGLLPPPIRRAPERSPFQYADLVVHLGTFLPAAALSSLSAASSDLRTVLSVGALAEGLWKARVFGDFSVRVADLHARAPAQEQSALPPPCSARRLYGALAANRAALLRGGAGTRAATQIDAVAWHQLARLISAR